MSFACASFSFSRSEIKSLETFLITRHTLVFAKHIHKHAHINTHTHVLEPSQTLLLADSYWRDEHKQACCWVTEWSWVDQFPLPWNLNISLFTFVQGWDGATVTERKLSVPTCVCVSVQRGQIEAKATHERNQEMKMLHHHLVSQKSGLGTTRRIIWPCENVELAPSVVIAQSIMLKQHRQPICCRITDSWLHQRCTRLRALPHHDLEPAPITKSQKYIDSDFTSGWKWIHQN